MSGFLTRQAAGAGLPVYLDSRDGAAFARGSVAESGMEIHAARWRSSISWLRQYGISRLHGNFAWRGPLALGAVRRHYSGSVCLARTLFARR